MNGTVCPLGHELLFVDLMADGLLRVEDEWVRLGPAGDDWLMKHGASAPAWRGEGSTPLRAWQAEALEAWVSHGRHGVIEAVTGTGKSRVGVEAAKEALREDYSVLIVVPTIDLVEQWVRGLRQAGVPAERIRESTTVRPDLRGPSRIVVSTVQSLYADPPVREDGKVLLVADECHRYGSTSWSRVLHGSYRRRLGLTATFERNDDGLTRLLSYFGGSPIFHIGFKRAIQDGVVAPYDVALVGVDLQVQERRAYDEADEVVRDCRDKLLAAGFSADPFGTFMAEVTAATRDEYEDPTVGEVAARYLWAFARRIEILCEARAKLTALEQLVPRINASRGTIVFTRQIDSATEMTALLLEHGVAAESIHSKLSRGDRRDRLARLKRGRTKAVVAPTILDEGIDVPDVDLGVVTAGSRSRRQMIQRMGRILRLKPDGRAASFIVLYARGTLEDLSLSDGQESCLDLIVSSARRVRHGLDFQDGATRPAGEALRRAGPPDFDGDVASAVTISPEAVRDYQAIHDVDGETAEAAISRLAVDLADAGELTREQDCVLVEARGVALRLDLGLSSVVGYWGVSLAKSHEPEAPVRGDDVPENALDETTVIENADQRDVDLVAQLERLAHLYATGALSDSEFARAKHRLLG